MSKLIDLLEIQQTGRYRFVPESAQALGRYLDVKSEFVPKCAATPAEYRVRVELGTNVVIREGMNAEPAMTLARKNLQRLVFGEFSDDIAAIHMALLDCDINAAQAALLALEKKMFSA